MLARPFGLSTRQPVTRARNPCCHARRFAVHLRQCHDATEHRRLDVRPVVRPEFFGGAPQRIPADQVGGLFTIPDCFGPRPKRLYNKLATHYSFAVPAVPAARSARPGDTLNVENEVLALEKIIPSRYAAWGNRPIAALLVDQRSRPSNYQEAAWLPANRVRDAGCTGASIATDGAFRGVRLEERRGHTDEPLSFARQTRRGGRAFGFVINARAVFVEKISVAASSKSAPQQPVRIWNV